jgi:hypothetical protein
MTKLGLQFEQHHRFPGVEELTRDGGAGPVAPDVTARIRTRNARFAAKKGIRCRFRYCRGIDFARYENKKSTFSPVLMSSATGCTGRTFSQVVIASPTMVSTGLVNPSPSCERERRAYSRIPPDNLSTAPFAHSLSVVERFRRCVARRTAIRCATPAESQADCSLRCAA